jgi:hypothetical protein
MVEPIRPVDRRSRAQPPPVAPVRRVWRGDPRDAEEQAERERPRQQPPPEPGEDREDEPGPGHVDVLA